MQNLLAAMRGEAVTPAQPPPPRSRSPPMNRASKWDIQGGNAGINDQSQAPPMPPAPPAPPAPQGPQVIAPPGQGYSLQGQGYSPDQGQWSGADQGQGYNQGPPAFQGQGYSPQGQGYSPQGQGYSSQAQGYGADQSQWFSPDQGQGYNQGYDKGKSKGWGKSQEVCKFFQNGFCGFGDQCQNLHVAPPARKICPFFQKGFCGFGDECMNLHEKKPVCKFFQQGYCGFGDQCQSLHEAPKELCKFFAAGWCGYGDECNNRHELLECEMICPFFAKGWCGFGDQCTKKHEAPAEPAWKSSGSNSWKSSGSSDWKSNDKAGWNSADGGNAPDATGSKQNSESNDNSWEDPNKWWCPACNKSNATENVICYKCGAVQPDAEKALDAETILFEKYSDAFKKWQKQAEDNRLTWQTFCDTNGQARKYDPRRKDLKFMRQFFRGNSIPSPDPVADDDLDANGGPKHQTFAQAPTFNKIKADASAPAADAAAAPSEDPMVQYQLQLYLYQQALLQQQAAAQSQPAPSQEGTAAPSSMYAMLAAQYGEAGKLMAAQYGL